MPPLDRPSLADTALWTAVDGLRVRYAEDADRSGPDVLLLGPWPLSFTVFDSSWPYFADAGRAVAIDLPGFGLSEPRLDLLTPKAMAGFVLKVIDRFRLRHPHLIAPSIWWTCAAEVALVAPGALESVIIGGDPISDLGDASIAPRRLTREELQEAVKTKLEHSSVAQSTSHDILDALSIAPVRPAAAYVQEHQNVCREFARALPSLTIPTLIINGSEAANACSIARARDAMPRSTVAIVGQGVFPWLESPEVFGEQAATWISGDYRNVGGRA